MDYRRFLTGLFAFASMVSALSCNTNQRPDPAKTVEIFLQDLEYKGIPSASKHLLNKPDPSWSEYSVIGKNEETFKKWMAVSGGDVIVEYLGIGEDGAREIIEKYGEAGIVTSEGFIKTWSPFSFSNFTPGMGEYKSESNKDTYIVRGRVKLRVLAGAGLVPDYDYQFKVVVKFGSKGWKVTDFSSYDDSMKHLLGG